jgi:hypothetical protein
MLAASPQIVYIHEPFNRTVYRPGICAARFDKWMTYLTPETGRPYERAFADMLRFRFRYDVGLRHAETPIAVLRVFARGARSFFWSVTRKRPLIKDPIAIFSAAWLHETFGVLPVVLIRHPGAFVSSVVRLNWRFDFNDLLTQPELMRDLLSPFADELRAHAAAGLTGDPVDQAAFLWNVIHHVIGVYQERHPAWIFLRYEDLASDPVAQFESLYARLGLPFTDKVRQTIASSTDDSNPAVRDDSTPHVTRLDSRTAARSWSKKLTAQQIERIRSITAPYAERYYTPSEW